MKDCTTRVERRAGPARHTHFGPWSAVRWALRAALRSLWVRCGFGRESQGESGHGSPRLQLWLRHSALTWLHDGRWPDDLGAYVNRCSGVHRPALEETLQQMTHHGEALMRKSAHALSAKLRVEDEARTWARDWLVKALPALAPDDPEARQALLECLWPRNGQDERDGTTEQPDNPIDAFDRALHGPAPWDDATPDSHARAAPASHRMTHPVTAVVRQSLSHMQAWANAHPKARAHHGGHEITLAMLRVASVQRAVRAIRTETSRTAAGRPVMHAACAQDLAAVLPLAAQLPREVATHIDEVCGASLRVECLRAAAHCAKPQAQAMSRVATAAALRQIRLDAWGAACRILWFPDTPGWSSLGRGPYRTTARQPHAPQGQTDGKPVSAPAWSDWAWQDPTPSGASLEMHGIIASFALDRLARTAAAADPGRAMDTTAMATVVTQWCAAWADLITLASELPAFDMLGQGSDGTESPAASEGTDPAKGNETPALPLRNDEDQAR